MDDRLRDGSARRIAEAALLAVVVVQILALLLARAFWGWHVLRSMGARAPVPVSSTGRGFWHEGFHLPVEAWPITVWSDLAFDGVLFLASGALAVGLICLVLVKAPDEPWKPAFCLMLGGGWLAFQPFSSSLEVTARAYGAVASLPAWGEPWGLGTIGKTLGSIFMARFVSSFFPLREQGAGAGSRLLATARRAMLSNWLLAIPLLGVGYWIIGSRDTSYVDLGAGFAVWSGLARIAPFAPEALSLLVSFVLAAALLYSLAVVLVVAREARGAREPAMSRWLALGLLLLLLGMAVRWPLMFLSTRLGPLAPYAIVPPEMIDLWSVRLDVFIPQDLLVLHVTILLSFGATAYAVLGKGAVDPTLALRRTAVYGTVGFAFLFFLAGLGNLAQEWFERAFGLPGSLGTIVTGGTLAVLLTPVKRRMDSAMKSALPATTAAEAPTAGVAVVFSELCGYAAPTGADEGVGFPAVAAFQKAAHRAAREHGGRLVEVVADEVMLEFADAPHAVRAALQLLDELHEAPGTSERPVETRTGIHYGAVGRSADGIPSGDAVNTASRIQREASPGAILVSEAVRNLLPASDFVLEDLGEKRLKNVDEPVRCFRMV